MFRKLIPVVLAILGLGLGLGAGVMLRPAPKAAESGGKEVSAASAHSKTGAATDKTEYVKLANQFVIPLIKHGKVGSMVVMSLSIEVAAGQSSEGYAKEPKLRDAFLQVMFDHANAGGFDGAFTDSGNMRALRKALLESARQVLGGTVSDVLITNIVRQDS